MDKWWIKLSTQIQDHWIWQNHEYAYAWIDLLMMVNRSDNKLLVDDEIVVIKRGQTLTSICKLSKRWGWSRNKTYKFILALEKDGMLKRKSTTHYTTLTIVNYGKYQNKGATVGTTKSTTVDTTEGQRPEHNIRRDKNRKENKESGSASFVEEAAAKEERDPNRLYPGDEGYDPDRLYPGDENYSDVDWDNLPEQDWRDDE